MTYEKLEFKNPICTIKDEPVPVFGGLVDVVVASGEHVPCPKCKGREFRICRDTLFNPMGCRLTCDNCGFSVPEAMEEMAYTTEEGLKLALKAWDCFAAYIEGEGLFHSEDYIPIEVESEHIIEIDGIKLNLDTMDFLGSEKDDLDEPLWPEKEE